MAFLSELHLTPDHASWHLWRHTAPLVYQDDVVRLTIKPGAGTDGASIPRLLWTIFGPPLRDWRVAKGAAIHDQLYKTLGMGVFTRHECDCLFYRALRATGVNRFHARGLYLGTRVGGWVGWRRYARDPAEVHRQQEYIEWMPA